MMRPATSGWNGWSKTMSASDAGRRAARRPWFYPLIGSFPAMLVAGLALSIIFGSFANAQKEPASSTKAGTTCPSTSDPALIVRCVSFLGHLYAVADIDLHSLEIVFTAANDGKPETFPAIVSNMSREGMKPLLVTNAGIYSADNRPLGLLISPKGKLHDVNRKVTGPGHGNFSWDSAVFQISDDGTASIVSARAWQEGRQHTVAATQSGPQLASSGKINQSFQAQSNWSFTRTAIGVDQSNRRIVHLVVSRDFVTLFELATFMVNELHCSEALHLDGNLSAFYIPSASERFLFTDPGERIVTALSVITKNTSDLEKTKPSRSLPQK